MKNCNNCGAEIDDGSIFCPFCGARYDAKKKKEKKSSSTDGAYGGSYDERYGYIPNYGGHRAPVAVGGVTWVTVLSFIFPIVGLILWYVWRFSKPDKSDSAANGALTGTSFMLPIAGVAIWYVSRYRNPQRAKNCATAAFIGVIFTLVYTLVATVLFERFGIVIYF